MRKFIEEFRATDLKPDPDTISKIGEQVFAMHIKRGATGLVEHRVVYYHPNPIKRYWVRLLLTLGIIKKEKYCGNCIN
jgi:hypothetical protein